MVPYAASRSHCSFCGAYFLEQKTYPRKCIVCENITYSNPLPVNVSMIRISYQDKLGIIIVRRAKGDQSGSWALPGGYLETGETWEEGAAREVKEEVGIDLDSNKFECYTVASSSGNTSLLIFNTYQDVLKWEDVKFIPNSEVSDIDICFMPTELAFSTHTKYLEKYLKEII